MTKKMPSIEVRRQRWLEFADFMDSLPEEKFNHSNWCNPSIHTCGTSACVAGWAGVQYSEQVKFWMSKVFERQKTCTELASITYKQENIKLIENLEDKKDQLYLEVRDLEVGINWFKIGGEALHITGAMKYKLFLPSNIFWNGSRGIFSHTATNKDIALIFRYLATLPANRIRLPPKFEPSQAMMERRVAKFNKDQANAAV